MCRARGVGYWVSMITRLAIVLALYMGLAAAVIVQIPTHDADLSTLHRKGSTMCDDVDYRKTALKLIKEAPFAGLFRDVKNQTKWEASGIAAVRGQFYVVFDSSHALGLLDDSFSFRGKNNVLIGDPGPDDSQFEGIAYVPENDTFLLLHEAYPSKQGTADAEFIKDEPYQPVITTAKLSKDQSDYEVLERCPVDFDLTHANKGFESIMYVHTASGETYLLGLCEGNFCVGGAEGADPGNGRIVVSQLERLADGCVWKPVKTIAVPSGAFFRDYSAMAINHALGKIAILSQEDAAVWIGDFDVDAVDFASEEGVVYHMPRDNHCHMVYCNVEGVQWLDPYRLLITSDRAKSNQPFWCSFKDQMVHIMALPHGWRPYDPAAVSAAALAEKDEL